MDADGGGADGTSGMRDGRLGKAEPLEVAGGGGGFVGDATGWGTLGRFSGEPIVCGGSCFIDFG